MSKKTFVISHPVFRCSNCGSLSASGASHKVCNECEKYRAFWEGPLDGRLIVNDAEGVGEILTLAGADARRFQPNPDEVTELKYWLRGYKAFRVAVLRLLEMDGGER